MRIVMLVAVIAAFFVTPAWAGEEQTTWRVGDSAPAKAVCFKLEHLIQVAELYQANDPITGNDLFDDPKSSCFHLRPITVWLVEYASGPYAIPDGRSGSIWLAKDRTGVAGYILFDDAGGPHERADMRSAA